MTSIVTATGTLDASAPVTEALLHNDVAKTVTGIAQSTTHEI